MKERELRRIQIVQGQIKQASINVNRLMVDLQFVNRQVLAAEPDSWDCNLPQISRDVDCEDFSAFPYANADEKESALMMTPISSDPRMTTTVTTASGTISSPTLKCSPTEGDSMNCACVCAHVRARYDVSWLTFCYIIFIPSNV